MRILLINEVFGTTSTGKLCAQWAQELEAQGNEVKVAYGRWGDVPEKYERFAHRIGSDIEVKIHGALTRAFDIQGLASVHATEQLIKWADEFNPDLLWLHNLHGYYINYKILFRWIKSRPAMKVQWTLHDCWAFTGHCAYFTLAGCDKWKTGCGDCPQKKAYPSSLLFDRSEKNFRDKKEAFCGIKNMTLFTPSEWLANLVKQSFLSEYPVEVYYNPVDTTVFKPTPSDFRKKYELENKKIILGVASVWTKRKGLDDFLYIAKHLDSSFAIILVGLTKKQIETLPDNIIGIERTNNAAELAGIYTEADLFANPSYEETFGLTTVEAQSCGTPAIVYSDTACEEIAKKYGGIVVEQGAENVLNAIIDFFEKQE